MTEKPDSGRKVLEIGVDAAAVAALVADVGAAGGDNAVWETIEEGFRAIIGAINETSKRCIVLLVTEYFKRQDLPDRDFQLLAGLLAASDEPILRSLFAVTSQLVEVNVESPDRRNFQSDYSYGFYRAHNHELKGIWWDDFGLGAGVSGSS